MFAASSEPSAEPAPISEWISSMKIITSSEEVSSEMIPFSALLELAAVLGAGDDERQIERQDALVQERGRNLAVDDPRRQALDDRGLPDAGLSQENRVVLPPAREDLDDALELDLAADQRVEHPALRHLRQVARELVEERASPSSSSGARDACRC